MGDRTIGGYCFRCAHSQSDGHCEIEETIAARDARIAELEAALRPFANVAISEQVIDPEVGDTDCFSAEAWMLRKVIAVLGEKAAPEESHVER